MTANILIVDDLDLNIKVLEIKLLNEYYTVFTANSGASALKLLEQNKIDVILLDIMMPDMDGFEVCARIKSNPDTSHIPIVMVTALSDVEDRIKGLETGADEFLTKPVDDVALFTRIKSLSRMKMVIDELKLRNTTNAILGTSEVILKNSFLDRKILCINDDAVQARNINKMLSTITDNITVISSTIGLNIESFYEYDLIIISCQLTEEDPLRIAVTLRSKENLHDRVLILLAEVENMPIVVRGMELGVNDYFIYPIEQSELQVRIKTQLRKKQYQDSLRNILEQTVDLSIKDGLTSIFNRRYFDIHIEQIINKSSKTAKPFCLLMIDIDDFKEVNDLYGHQAGDILLKLIASTLKTSVRVTDLVARYGGEEFVVSLNDTYIDQGILVAERIRQAIEVISFNYNISAANSLNVQIKKTISIGITEYKIGESSYDTINRADQALYQAKENGKNKVIKL
jgi:two-component system cell cycle response regulator